VTLLTDGKSRNTDPVWSNDGKMMAYGSTRPDGNDVDVWLTEPANPSGTDGNRMLAQMTGGGWGALDWSPDDKQIPVMEEISANQTYLWLVDSSRIMVTGGSYLGS
jgi:Tol biopolymer transport system component